VTPVRRLAMMAGAAAATAVLLAGLLALVVAVPERAIDPAGLSRADWLHAVQDLRTTLLQGMGGLLLLATGYFSARTLQLNRRGQLTERFTRAVEQLGQAGPERLAVRLGGIYALEQIAMDSEELHWAAMEVLVAFVVNTPAGEGEPVARPWLDEPPRWERDRAPIPTDLQAAATVLGRRPETRRRWERRQDRRLQLRFADLRRVSWIGAHLEGARLTGARLDGANLREADLRGALLRGANLRDGNLGGARLEGADLAGAHLEQTRLTGAHLEGADLRGAHLDGADLTGAHLEGAVGLPDA
jgi:Pentapeptide repeats (8 copies)